MEKWKFGLLFSLLKLVVFFVMPRESAAQNYTAGVAVCDTIGPSFQYFADCPDAFLEFRVDSAFVPYVSGLDFQVEILSTQGIVLSNKIDTVKAGDTFTIPDTNDIDLRISFEKTGDSFTFITKVMGIPEIAGETYRCELLTATTTALCHNWFDLTHLGNQSNCTVQPLVSSIEPFAKVPDKYELKPNYPNPFNPSTNISYSIPEENFVSLVVYDLLGREVRTLVNAYQSAGVHSIQFDGTDIPSGVYFYVLQVGHGFKKSGKMILLK